MAEATNNEWQLGDLVADLLDVFEEQWAPCDWCGSPASVEGCGLCEQCEWQASVNMEDGEDSLDDGQEAPA